MNSFKYSIHKYRELDSTNDYALRNKDTLVQGDVIVANKQSNGHGRFERKWISDNESNVYLTIVLGEIINFSVIPLYAAVVLVRVLESLGVKAKIKWPNDILVDGKKMAGILVQNALHGNNSFVVVGIGLNISLSEEEKDQIGVPVTCLNEIDVSFTKDNVIKLLLDSFFIDLESFIDKGFSYIKAEYEDKSSLIGKQITVKCFQKELIGKVMGFSDKGEILLNENGKTVAVSSGEVVRVL